MTSKLKLLATSAVASAAILGINPAFAADLGTDAGTSITNNVSVAYNVAGSIQTAETDTDTFVVDRKVNLLVAKTDAVNTQVASGATQQALTYNVTNLTNDTIDVLLTAENLGGDDFDTTGAVTYYLDDGDGIFNVGDTLITSIDNLAEDDTVTVHLVTDIPGGLSAGDTADVVLVGQAADSGTGVAFADDSANAADATVVQNVFADGDGTGSEGANDGYHSDTDTYEVVAAAITAFKSSVVISDPISGVGNGTTIFPKAIPGAVIEYCISVDNAASAATATGVVITDTLPADVGGNGITFVGGSILVDGTAVITPAAGPVAKSQVCTGGSAGGSFSGSTVSGPLSDIAGGSNRTMTFRVTVD